MFLNTDKWRFLSFQLRAAIFEWLLNVLISEMASSKKFSNVDHESTLNSTELDGPIPT